MELVFVFVVTASARLKSDGDSDSIKTNQDDGALDFLSSLT